MPKLNLNKEQKKGFLKPLNQFQEYVQKNFSKEDILGVYVHGSLADMEYVPHYSDFDAFLLNPVDPGWGSSNEVQKELLLKAREAGWLCKDWSIGLELCRKVSTETEELMP